MSYRIATCSTSQGEKLEGNEILISGQYLTSPNCEYSFWLETDGNLILYKGLTNGRTDLWASQTGGKGTAPYTLKMQAHDHHLVLYDSAGDTIWSTDVYGGNWEDGAYLSLQDDGNLIVYDGDGDAMWMTSTAGGTISTEYGTGTKLEKGKRLRY